MSDHAGEYGLVLSFDTDDGEFCRGFEAGNVDAACGQFAAADEPDEHVETVHATNAEMMLRIAEAHGLAVRSEEVGDGWMHVVFVRSGTGDVDA